MIAEFCDVCSMRHDVCGSCGGAVVASLYLHRKMNAHGNGPHWCGEENPRYQEMLRAMREDSDGQRELLTECPRCQDDVIRRADSPVLYDVHGYYGLQGDAAVHNCAAPPLPDPLPAVPTYKEGGTVPGHVPSIAPTHRVIDL